MCNIRWTWQWIDVDAIKQLIKFLNVFSQKEDKVVIVISHYAQLINSLNVDTVTILGKDKTVTGDLTLANDVLTNGFSDYVWGNLQLRSIT